MCSLSVIAHLMSKMKIIQYIRPFETKLKGTRCLDKTVFFTVGVSEGGAV